MKLQAGDRIRVVGFVMLQRLDSGREYEVVKVYYYRGWLDIPAYEMRRITKRGSIDKRRKSIGHKVSSVDLWVGGDDLNRIDRL